VESLGHKGQYIALSHCWGAKEGIITATKATIKDRMEAILCSCVPKTFRDAVSITRTLKIEYLWIDSLCIIQDDKSDWKSESAKMADVYSRSYLTIAATGSATSLGGCLFPRWYETGEGLKISHSLSELQYARLQDKMSEDENFGASMDVRVRYLPTCWI
jgi:hypothetical protein